MNNNILEYLEQCELSEIEAKLYLALLETGPATIRDLAERINIKRTTGYFHIDLLIEKGLVMKLVKDSQKRVAVYPPEESLKNLVERNLQKAEQLNKNFPDIIQTIQTTLPQLKDISEAEIRYYKGKNGVRKIYEEALKANELRSYVKIVDTGGIFPNNVDLFNNAFKRNPNLTIKEILYDSPLAKEQAPQLLSKNNRYAYKFIPNDTKLSSEDTILYDGKVAIVNYSGDISSVILKSMDHYRNSIALFDFIWRTIP